MRFEKAYTYDDLMLVPRHSEIRSRKEPNTDTSVGTISKLEIPIIAAPMNTVVESEMAQAMSQIGASSVIHRYMSLQGQWNVFRDSLLPCDGYRYEPWVAIGASGDYMNRVEILHRAGARQFCIDVANGHSVSCLHAVSELRKMYRNEISIMAGNVCTADGAANLEEAGADVIRVGIGPGSMCTTRLVTGFGVPQLTAIENCAEAVDYASIVADGGIRSSGDIVKALAMGADAVMIGGLLAGTLQTPGNVKHDFHKKPYKEFHGMASEAGRSEWFSKSSTSFVPEGSSTRVRYNGTDAKEIVLQLNNSVKVGMSFAGARNLSELRQNATWVEVTDNGRKEGTPNMRMYK